MSQTKYFYLIFRLIKKLCMQKIRLNKTYLLHRLSQMCHKSQAKVIRKVFVVLSYIRLELGMIMQGNELSRYLQITYDILSSYLLFLSHTTTIKGNWICMVISFFENIISQFHQFCQENNHCHPTSSKKSTNVL